MEKNKLREIQKELIICEKPSSYLEEIKDSLRNTPLDALLILQNTEQNLKYHPEGNVWNHVMQVIDTAAKVKEFANDKESLMMGALLHDVGKGEHNLNVIEKSIMVILNKMTNGKIKKYDNIKSIDIYYNHGEKGAKLLQSINSYDDKFLDVIKYHHMNNSMNNNELLDIIKESDNIS